MHATMVRPEKMSNMTGGGRTALMAAAVVLTAILATQTYALLAAGSGTRTSTGPNPSTGVDPQSNTITVSGTGQAQLQPDRAILAFGVVAQASTAEDAVQKNANVMSSVISALEGIGVSGNNIRTTSFSISPQTSCCSGPPSITGYQVTNQVEVTIVASGQSLEQLGSKVGQAIDVAASKGANQVYGVQFTASNSALQRAQQAALQQAAQNASSEAHVLASALGVTITGVVSATTSQGYTPPIYYSVPTLATSTTPVVPPQSLTVTATVQVTYAIG